MTAGRPFKPILSFGLSGLKKDAKTEIGLTGLPAIM
jgi:hypothetical protein